MAHLPASHATQQQRSSPNAGQNVSPICSEPSQGFPWLSKKSPSSKMLPCSISSSHAIPVTQFPCLSFKHSGNCSFCPICLEQFCIRSLNGLILTSNLWSNVTHQILHSLPPFPAVFFFTAMTRYTT